MDLDATAELDADPDEAFTALQDLATYSHWLGIVGSAVAQADDVWSVRLVGRVGPLTRTKQVRMVRTERDPVARSVRFERREMDRRHHNQWVLSASAAAASAGRTEVRVHVHYGGGLRLPGAERLLKQEVRDAGRRLQAFLDRP